MGVEPQVDDVADAKSVDIGQLRLGLAGSDGAARRQLATVLTLLTTQIGGPIE